MICPTCHGKGWLMTTFPDSASLTLCPVCVGQKFTHCCEGENVDCAVVGASKVAVPRGTE